MHVLAVQHFADAFFVAEVLRRMTFKEARQAVGGAAGEAILVVPGRRQTPRCFSVSSWWCRSTGSLGTINHAAPGTRPGPSTSCVSETSALCVLIGTNSW